MNLSSDDIKLIARLIAEKMGPDFSADRVKSLVLETVDRLANMEAIETPEKTEESISSRKLIINAFGLNTGGLDETLRAFIAEKGLPQVAVSSSVIDKYCSVVIIFDYSRYEGDLNRLKFELSEICEQHGYKVIVQESGYYGHL